MFDADTLIEVFRDTMDRVAFDPELQKAETDMLGGSRIYPETFFAKKSLRNRQGLLEKQHCSIIESAVTECENHKLVTLVNTICDLNPGGGVLQGSEGTQETLCRCSTVYSSLVLPETICHFYQYQERNPSGKRGNLIYYSPFVRILKTDRFYSIVSNRPQVSVLTCLDPMAFSEKLNKQETESRLEMEMQNLFEVASHINTEVLILRELDQCDSQGSENRIFSTAQKLLGDYEYKGQFEKVIVLN